MHYEYGIYMKCTFLFKYKGFKLWGKKIIKNWITDQSNKIQEAVQNRSDLKTRKWSTKKQSFVSWNTVPDLPNALHNHNEDNTGL